MHVVVESPTKARTLRGYLGTGHTVIATRGHVQDLEAKDGSVDPARGFAMVYATKPGATRALGAIAAALADADSLVLATDPDREAEAVLGAFRATSMKGRSGARAGSSATRSVRRWGTRSRSGCSARPGWQEKRSCPSCAGGRLGLKFGPFVGCARYLECRYTRPLARDPAEDGAGPVALGTDPETGLALTLRTGRYGRYVQRAEDGKDPQAARGTVPMGMEAHDIASEVGRALLALPRTVGTNPETGKDILAEIGRYGPWLKHGAAYLALPEDEDVLTVGLNRAVMLVDTA